MGARTTAVGYPILKAQNVTKRYGDSVALDRVSLRIDSGEFFCLLGPSGCGKSTLMRMLAGFEEPSEGRVLLAGEDLAGVPPYRRPVNMMFQSYALFPHMSVEKNVAYGLRQEGMARDAIAARVAEMLKLVQMERFASRRPDQLSGGQRQRVALARALAKRPKVLLLDEPLGALDLKLRKEMQVFLKRLHAELGTTFVYVTHDQEEALAMSDRVAVMNLGRIEQIGPPREIYDRPATPFVAGFIGETNFIRGDGGTIAVRPERMLLAGGSNGGRPGGVVRTMVIGPAIQCVVKIGNGQEVLVGQERAGAGGVESLRAGDRVVLTWADDAALVLEGGMHG